MNDYYAGADDSAYYIRELEDNSVVWVGESSARDGELAYVNVFWGTRNGSQAHGDLIDIPKGQYANHFENLQVDFSASPTTVSFNHPDLGQIRVLSLTPSDLPRAWVQAGEWGCGFYDEQNDAASFSLTGVWRADDGGVYYVRQIGQRVVWYGENLPNGWAHVFFGTLSPEGLLEGRWADVPSAESAGQGTLSVQVTIQDPMLPAVSFLAATKMSHVAATGGFGGRTWHKTDSIRYAIHLSTLTINANVDVGGLNQGGDEPYLLPMYITIGGNEFPQAAPLLNGSTPGLPTVTSPLFQTPWGTSGDWPKNNLTAQENLPPGTALPIPEFITYAEGELRTVGGLQPNSTLARDTANVIPGLVAMEEASSRNEDVRAAYQTLLARAPAALRAAIIGAVGSGTFSLPAVVARVTATLTTAAINAAVTSATSDLFGILGGLDRDKFVGTAFPAFSFGALRGAALDGNFIPISMSFRFPDTGGLWVVTGSLTALRSPRFAGSRLPPTSLELTVQTGNDDKREGSVVGLVLGFVDRTTLPPLPIHVVGQRFPDRTLHTFATALPVPNRGQPTSYTLVWTRDGGNWPQQPDGWEIIAARVCLFDAIGQRTVVKPLRRLNLKLTNNTTIIL